MKFTEEIIKSDYKPTLKYKRHCRRNFVLGKNIVIMPIFSLPNVIEKAK